MVTPITRKVQMSLKEVMMSLVQGDVISTGDNHDIVVVRTISNRAVLGYMCPYCNARSTDKFST
jgi:urease accessory protein UreE